MSETKPTPDYLKRLSREVYLRRCDENGRAVKSLRSLAKEVDVSLSTLSRAERGHTVSLETFRIVCLALGISADEVLGLEKGTAKCP